MRVAAVAIAVAASLGAAAGGDGFAAAVLRRDGILLPFAAFDGKRWSHPWPAAQRAGDLMVPISLSAVPKSWWGPTPPLHEWQALLPGGGPVYRGPACRDLGAEKPN